MKIRYLIFFILILKTSFLVSQNSIKDGSLGDSLHFHLLDVSSGLSHNFINDIKQDSLGFMWIATIDGLNRYDGNQFVQFKKQRGSSERGLVNNYIQQLELKNGKELVVATDAGLVIYNSRIDKFQLINTEDGLLNNSVSAIETGPGDNSVIGTYRGGIQFANNKWDLKYSRENFVQNINLTSNEISSIQLQQDSILWVGTYNDGLNKINLKNGRVSHLFEKNKSTTSRVINSLYEDIDGNLWVGTRNGLHVITRLNDTISINAKSGSQGLSDMDVLCFEEDLNNNIWIGTRNGGLNILEKSSLFNDSSNINIRRYLPRNDGSSVYNRTVSVITRDKDNNMWIGTPTGINYVNPLGDPVRLITHSADKKSISHNRIGALAQSGEGKVWIGTDGGGLDLYDPQTGIIFNYHHNEEDQSSLSNNYILSILEDSKDRIWVGTYQGGLNRLDIKNGKARHYLQGSVSNGSDVRVIFESRNGTIWVGTNRGGLYKYIEGKDRFKYIESLGKIDIRSIVEDQEEGVLWFATFGSGLIKYNPEADDFQSFNEDNTKGFNSDIIFSVLLMENGEVLAGTRFGGILRFNPKTKEVLTFSVEDGLSNNTVNSLIWEDETYIWMGTYNGINRYNVETNEILDVSSLDNLQSGEFNIGAALKNSSGNLYFGGNNGLNILDPNHFKRVKQDYPLLFQGLKVLNKTVEVRVEEKNSILRQAIFYQDKIKLNHNQNSFSVEFASLKYPEAHNLTYSYKLENHNKYWIEDQKEGIANFTSVPPGEYILKVRVNSGVNTKNYKELKFNIVPPIWKTWPAYLLYFIMATILIWISFKYYSERVHLKNSLLFEKKQRHLEKDLNEERFRFFTAFSHELKTPLTLILAPVENLLEIQNKKIKTDLLFIQRNARKLHHSINKLLEFRKAEEGLSQLNRREHDISENLKTWIENYLPLAKEKNITLEYSLPVDKKIFNVDIEKIEVVINNLLSNAIKYCKINGEVKISLICNSDNFKITVSDTGTGISKEELSHIFNWYYRSNSNVKEKGNGIGLALSKRFAELHGGSIHAESTPEEKTIFTLAVPAVEIKEVEEHLNRDDEKVVTGQVFSDNIKSRKQTANLKPNKDRRLILIIDDNEEILNFLSNIFKEEYDIIHSRNGREGIVKASNYVPDLIISDVMMPEKNGVDLCFELKQQHSTSHIPIILLTAKGNFESINLGYEQGADDYIVKPFNPKLLKTRVKNLLFSREQLQHHFKGVRENKSKTEEKVSVLLTKEKEFLSELDLIIAKNMGKGTDNVDLISQKVGMSRTSLYRKLKAITGLSINEYIRNLKIERAAELIKNENFSVSQASYEVGFTNLKYFRKIFKEKFGKTPREFKS
ncbi:hypothetical protein APR41_05695 [Salegentibacter salinarum]|uniref:histidine kinase n=1 Tax=Salegentibacter salinarum TaxID=447422 RepID=A0A2N0TSI4_9FLAO|nr:two-component regulator propeller domain-containing protein [Salegentibacter salinarum]PKD17701.1 hypothetical protein APR41_05695 [Salegentibacter salinarum]SKB51155.1 Signal transduction histidine kinase [Salegentibacter salinarum]